MIRPTVGVVALVLLAGCGTHLVRWEPEDARSWRRERTVYSCAVTASGERTDASRTERLGRLSTADGTRAAARYCAVYGGTHIVPEDVDEPDGEGERRAYAVLRTPPLAPSPGAVPVPGRDPRAPPEAPVLDDERHGLWLFDALVGVSPYGRYDIPQPLPDFRSRDREPGTLPVLPTDTIGGTFGLRALFLPVPWVGGGFAMSGSLVRGRRSGDLQLRSGHFDFTPTLLLRAPLSGVLDVHLVAQGGPNAGGLNGLGSPPDDTGWVWDRTGLTGRVLVGGRVWLTDYVSVVAEAGLVRRVVMDELATYRLTEALLQIGLGLANGRQEASARALGVTPQR